MFQPNAEVKRGSAASEAEATATVAKSAESAQQWIDNWRAKQAVMAAKALLEGDGGTAKALEDAAAVSEVCAHGGCGS
eukprot:1177171-Prorocentrum_minimum.AAC.3